MSENLIEQITEVARAFIVREVGEDAGPMMTEQARAFTDVVWAVVGPELDRLRAEVGQRDRARMESADRHQMQMDEVLCRAEAAEAERDDLRARLAKVEALADEWAAENCVTGYIVPNGNDDDTQCLHCAAERLHAALASAPEPSDSEPAPDADREAGGE